MTPLQRAQRFNAHFAEEHARIVDALRRQGWDREDAVERADELEAKALAVREAALARPSAALRKESEMKAERVKLEVRRGLAGEMAQWVADEMAHWPEGTAYQEQLAELAAQLKAAGFTAS